MRILIVNDDGIQSKGIEKLAGMAKEFGEVWVVAPDNQCSAMSQKITVRGTLTVKPYLEFPVEGVRAYSVSGTPADCVKVATQVIMPEKPDVTFSGINIGYNCGYDILYSGTVGACMESLIAGIPAIAFSSDMNCIYDAVDEFIYPITKKLLENTPKKNEIWNVNFPGCKASEIKGIKWNSKPAAMSYISDDLKVAKDNDGELELSIGGIWAKSAPEDCDISYLLENYISVGIVKNAIIGGLND